MPVTIPAYMKRYVARLTSFMTGYMVVLIGGLLLAQAGLATGWRVALAALTAAMICGVFWTIFRLLAECDDEYQRLLLVKQVLLGTAMTLAICTFWQFLAVYEVVGEGPRWIGAIWLIMFGFAAPLVRWRA